jgi:hypothetical protein
VHVIDAYELNLNKQVLVNQTNYTGGCYEVHACYDFANPLVDPRLDCAACGPPEIALTDYSCPDNFHCCLKGEKFDNGACCRQDLTCCTQNSNCGSDQFCDLSINACVVKGHSGSVCLLDSHCISSHCDNVTH